MQPTGRDDGGFFEKDWIWDVDCYAEWQFLCAILTNAPFYINIRLYDTKNTREMFDMDKIKHFNAITEEEHKEIEDIHKFSIIKLDRKSVLY